MFTFVKISGDSMLPVLTDGEIVMCKKIKPAALRSGLLCLVNHADLGLIIKRLGERDGDRWTLVGDNPASTPSAVMGLVEADRITHRILFRR